MSIVMSRPSVLDASRFSSNQENSAWCLRLFPNRAAAPTRKTVDVESRSRASSRLTSIPVPSLSEPRRTVLLRLATNPPKVKLYFSQGQSGSAGPAENACRGNPATNRTSRRTGIAFFTVHTSLIPSGNISFATRNGRDLARSLPRNCDLLGPLGDTVTRGKIDYNHILGGGNGQLPRGQRPCVSFPAPSFSGISRIRARTVSACMRRA